MKLFRSFTLASCVLMLFMTLGIAAQSNPRQEKLLNGLRVLMWSNPAADRVEMKLRIHAGSSFDPQDKEGVMRLLSEAIFPNQEIREFLTDELGGSFEIVTRYDYVQFNASSRPEEYLRMLETVASAVATPTIDKATVDAVRTTVLNAALENEKRAASIADQASARRLLGTFPYGRPLNGSSASLQRIDFADLRFAYDRLFGADNATLTISGNFDASTGFRAARRFFGAWRKSDRSVPATFRQPDSPPPGTQIVESPEPDVTEIRYSTRGVARNDKNFPAAAIAAYILQTRVRAKSPADRRADVFVRHDPTLLPGVLTIGFSNIRGDLTAAITEEKPNLESSDVIWGVLNERITTGEFTAAKAAIYAERGRFDDATIWLDVDTFRLGSVKADAANFDSATLADVQRVVDRFRSQPMASVLVLSPKNN